MRFLLFPRYDEGHYRVNRGYGYIVVIQTLSISVALYALVVFYLTTKKYLKPYVCIFYSPPPPLLPFGR